MKFTALSLVAFTAQQVAGHATFQALWVNGVDMISSPRLIPLLIAPSTCLRTPLSNSPVQNVLSNDIRCNANTGPAAQKCAVSAGSTVTVEMHQQPNDRSCTQEGIGGQHYGPVIVYMSKVSDAATADGSAGWFKIFHDGWAKKAGTTRGDDDFWGVKDLNTCCGRMNVKIPSDIPSGDYLLRSEVIALHSAGSTGGAQFYMSCFQLSVTGGGSASPALVNFPGAYAASDPGIRVDIHATLSSYAIPGPAVWSGGSVRVPGSGTCSGVESGTTTGPAVTTTTTSRTTAPPTTLTTTRSGGTTTTTSRTAVVTTTSAAPPVGCTVAKYGQCGGNGYTGCTVCAAGSTCSAVSPPYYSQCI